MYEKKLTVIGNKHVGERKTLQSKNTVHDLYSATLC